MNKPARVIEWQDGLEACLTEISKRGDFSVIDNVRESKHGRMATNLIVQTNKGKLLIRAYPEKMPKKLETGDFMFEIKALQFAASKGLNVPNLIQFEDGKNYLKIDNLVIIAYPLIEGVAVIKEELSAELGEKAGKFVAELANISQSFKDEDQFLDELNFIKNIFEQRALNYPEMKQDEQSVLMFQYIQEPKLRADLEGTPRGLVHGDFFFENFLICPDGECALIDFGDAYYGYLLSDICLAAMEFSAISEENWDFDILEKFMEPLKSWIQKNEIDLHVILDHMRTLCVKFFVYTIPLIELLEHNPYRHRFAYLSRHEVESKIISILEN